MKTLRVAPVVAVLLFSLTLGSVFGNGGGYTVGVPLLGTSGVPALASPSLFSGVITTLYADGSPVVLESNHVTLSLCASSCVLVDARLKQTSPGAYTYSFDVPTSISGTVTIYVTAGSLADDNGKIFPSVDTSIGTYASPSSSGTTSTPGAPGTPTPATAAPSSQTKQAVSETPTGQSPVITVITLLSVLAVAGSMLVLLPRRR